MSSKSAAKAFAHMRIMHEWVFSQRPSDSGDRYTSLGEFAAWVKNPAKLEALFLRRCDS